MLTNQNIIIGCNGLTGQSISRSLDSRSLPWVGFCHKRSSLNLKSLDITNLEQAKDVLSQFENSNIFLCANLSGGVNRAEFEEAIARSFYVDATINIGKVCLENNNKLMFISTDYVFDDGHENYSEETICRPLNNYGALKLEAENWIKENLNSYLIIRTTNIYGWDPQTVTPNFFMNIYNQIQEGKNIKASSALYGTPTYSDDLAEIVIDLIKSEENGLFHIVGPDCINRQEWAQTICNKFGPDMMVENLDLASSAVKRPTKVLLDTKKYKDRTSIRIRSLDEGISQIEELIKNGQKVDAYV